MDVPVKTNQNLIQIKNQKVWSIISLFGYLYCILDDPKQASLPQEVFRFMIFCKIQWLLQNLVVPTVKEDGSNIETPSDQFDGINKAISQIFSSRVMSISDSTKFQSTEV